MLLLRARPCVSSELELRGRGSPLADTHQAPLQLPLQMPPWRELRLPYTTLALSLICRGNSWRWNIPAVTGVPPTALTPPESPGLLHISD